MTENDRQGEDLFNNLSDRIRFEELISDISARFLNMQPDQVDTAIEATLQKILVFFR